MQPWQPDTARDQPLPTSSLNWYERNLHPEWQGASHIQNPTQDRPQSPVSYSETYQASHISLDVPSYQSTFAPPWHVSQLVSYEPPATRRSAHPPNSQLDPSSYRALSEPSYTPSHPSAHPAVYTSSSEAIRPQSSEESYPPLNQAGHPPSLLDASQSSNVSTNTTYLTPRLRDNLVLNTAAEPETDSNLATNRALYSTSQTEACERGMASRGSTNGLGPVRHSWRSAHSSQYVNSYAGPARYTVMRVPTSYACQYRAGLTIICPMLSRERLTVSCLYVSDIRGEPLHVTYNCLVSIFERYPGFRDLHITPGHTGAVVSFDTDYQTTIAKRALDGFWIFSKYKLSVKFVDPRIYKYMHLPGFNPEHFFQY